LEEKSPERWPGSCSAAGSEADIEKGASVGTLDDEVRELRARVERLETERVLGEVLARYGFYADHGRHREWGELFTEDGVMDLIMYTGEDVVHPEPELWKHRRFEGREELVRSILDSPPHMSIEGRSQHHMQGPPTIFFIDGDQAVAESYAVVYAKAVGDASPLIQRQSHSMNRWTFRKVDGEWKIAECFRRPMGHDDQSSVITRS
jgi:hypothetical protein